MVMVVVATPSRLGTTENTVPVGARNMGDKKRKEQLGYRL